MVKGVDVSAACRHPCLNVLMRRCEERLGHDAPRNTRLVGDHDNGEPAPIQLPHRVDSERKENQSREIVQVSGFLDQCSVTVYEYRRSAHVASLSQSRTASVRHKIEE